MQGVIISFLQVKEEIVIDGGVYVGHSVLFQVHCIVSLF